MPSNVLWLPGNNPGKTPTTATQMNAAALWKRKTIAEMAAVPTDDFTLYHNDADLYCNVAESGSYRWHPDKTLTPDGRRVVDANGPGQWVLELPSYLILSHLQKLDVADPFDGQYLYNTDSEMPEIFKNGRWYVPVLERADFDISGTVTNTLSTDPIEGVTVTANGNQVTATDANGEYTLTNVPRGAAITIAGVLAGFNTYNDTVNIAAGDAVKNFTMARRTLFGNITSSAGGVLSGVAVSISGPTRNDTSDGSGDYALIDVPDGSYTISATHPDHQAYSSPVPVVVNGDTEFDFVMTILTGTVSGTITSSVTSQPAPAGIPVVVAGLSAANTNSSGVYSRADVPRLSGQSVTVADGTYYNSYSDTVNVNSASVTKDFTLVPKSVGPFSVLTSGTEFNFNVGGNTTYGNRFLVNKTCRIVSIRFATVNAGTYVVKLWSDAGTLLQSASQYYSGSGTQTLNITATTLNAGTYYRVSAYCSTSSGNFGRYRSTFFGSLVTNHPAISLLNPNQPYQSGGDTFPNGSAGDVRIHHVEPVVQL